MEMSQEKTKKKGEERIPVVKRSFYSIFVKRFLDILLSGIAIIILCPVYIVVAILELIFHGRPIVYVQKRPGLNGKIFNIYKFRTMTNEVDENGNLLSDEKRLTKFGKILRKFSLDELPELFCILTGKMSIIGPRPLMPQYLELYTERHAMRHGVRPGLACLPIKPVTSWTWRDQFENDIYYIENVSFMLDLKMIFVIAKEALNGSEYRVEASRVAFNGKNLDE